MKKVKPECQIKPLTFRNRKFKFKDLLEEIITHYRGGPVKRFTLVNCEVRSIPKEVIVFRRLKIKGRWQCFFMGLFLEDYNFIKGCHFISKEYENPFEVRVRDFFKKEKK